MDLTRNRDENRYLTNLRTSKGGPRVASAYRRALSSFIIISRLSISNLCQFCHRAKPNSDNKLYRLKSSITHADDGYGWYAFDVELVEDEPTSGRGQRANFRAYPGAK